MNTWTRQARFALGLIVILAIAQASSGSARADTIQLRATDDAYTDSFSPDTNFGSSLDLPPELEGRQPGSGPVDGQTEG